MPNAVNSPFRSVAAASGKRSWAQAGEAVYGQPPPKKQVIEIPSDDAENLDPRRRDGVPVTAQDKLEEPFSKRSNAQPTAFERKLASAREKKTTPANRPEKSQKASADNIESVRQWQRHYRREFPRFVVYFDSVPDDVRLKAARQCLSLGAREEKFFSKAVTHVVTTRTIPPELNSTSPDEDSKYGAAQQKTVQLTALTQDQKRTTSLLDAHIQRRTQPAATSHDVDPRRAQGHNADILSRARELGIKIWALEKLQRMLKTILETDTGEQAPAHDDRSHVAVSRPPTKPTKDADLEQLLRNEKINGPADRDMTVAAQDMCTFRGWYIYIHDMDEKTKPVLVRDYPKPSNKELGKWPQFRVSDTGRCPFVEDPSYAKKQQQQKRDTATRAQEDIAAQRKTRAASALDTAQPAVLGDRPTNLRRSPRKLAPEVNASKPLDPPKGLQPKRQSSAEGIPLFNSAQQNLRGLPRMVGGEPMASGMQPSNVTSAIRSQVMSSAALSSTAPGLHPRRVDSKEVSALKRKVLSGVAASNQSMPSSYMNDMRAAINRENDNEPPPRAAKRKAQETLGMVLEDDENGCDGPRPVHRKPAPKRRKPVEREAKPGYCENCRDKYEDFDEVRFFPFIQRKCRCGMVLMIDPSTSSPASIRTLPKRRTTGRSWMRYSASLSGRINLS